MRPFSARVELPCQMFCGPDAKVELSGLVVKIDTGRMVLSLREGRDRAVPDVGDAVRLELLLPVKAAKATAKCLNVRARVAQTMEMPDGSRQLVLSFRRASFRDRSESFLQKMPKVATNGWTM